ncbi:hypothetical protein BTM_797 [Burkholderia thailandensis 34]|nr:hypothetical protein BTM_797 [Burkholderia thailandensis 34]
MGYIQVNPYWDILGRKYPRRRWAGRWALLALGEESSGAHSGIRE